MAGATKFETIQHRALSNVRSKTRHHTRSHSPASITHGELESIAVVTKPIEHAPHTAMTNWAGFGGTAQASEAVTESQVVAHCDLKVANFVADRALKSGKLLNLRTVR